MGMIIPFEGESKLKSKTYNKDVQKCYLFHPKCSPGMSIGVFDLYSE
jgi:hypothetical protein